VFYFLYRKLRFCLIKHVKFFFEIQFGAVTEVEASHALIIHSSSRAQTTSDPIRLEPQRINFYIHRFPLLSAPLRVSAAKCGSARRRRPLVVLQRAGVISRHQKGHCFIRAHRVLFLRRERHETLITPGPYQKERQGLHRKSWLKGRGCGEASPRR
jgi:hypothetical protein